MKKIRALSFLLSLWMLLIMVAAPSAAALQTVSYEPSKDVTITAQAAMLIVISQLAVAYLIELFGMFGVQQEPFVWRKILGMAIAIVGIVIFKWEKY